MPPLPPLPVWPTEMTPEAMALYSEQREAYLAAQRPEAEALAEAERAQLEQEQEELAATAPADMPEAHFSRRDQVMSDGISIYEPTRQSRDRCWGFVLYRVAFDDDEAWHRCLRRIKWCVHRSLAAHNRHVFDHLAPYLRWTVVEDPALDGASPDQVRRHFAAWSREQTGDPDDEPDVGDRQARNSIRAHLSRSPRHRYCVSIDGPAMRAMEARVSSLGLPEWDVSFGDAAFRLINAWHGTWKANFEPPPPTVQDLQDMMEDDWEQDGDGGGGEEEEDPDQGWMLFKAFCYNSMYAALSYTAWDDLFVPPPGVWPLYHHASLADLLALVLPITALATGPARILGTRAASSPLARRQGGCYEGTQQICYGRPGGTPQDIDPVDLEYAAYVFRAEAKQASAGEDGPSFLTMPTTGFDCEEWTVFTESSVMLLVKHNSPRYPARVLWADIADSIDGGEGASEEEKAASLLWCGSNGGQIGVKADVENEAYQTEEYLDGNYTFDVVIKAVRNS